MSFSRDPSCHIETPTYILYKEVYKQKWYQKGLLIALLEESHREYLQVSLQAYSTLTHCHEQPEDQNDCKKGTLSNQPQLKHVTPTALLGSWVVQPIKNVTSLGTDFKTHAKWQGSIEEPAAKDFDARKVRTIKLN
jgi:hypothetical protein